MTTPRSDPFIAHIERSVPGLLERYEVPALSVAVVEDTDVVWTQGFGACHEPVADRRGDLVRHHLDQVFVHGLVHADPPWTEPARGAAVWRPWAERARPVSLDVD